MKLTTAGNNHRTLPRSIHKLHAWRRGGKLCVTNKGSEDKQSTVHRLQGEGFKHMKGAESLSTGYRTTPARKTAPGVKQMAHIEFRWAEWKRLGHSFRGVSRLCGGSATAVGFEGGSNTTKGKGIADRTEGLSKSVPVGKDKIKGTVPLERCRRSRAKEGSSCRPQSGGYLTSRGTKEQWEI